MKSLGQTFDFERFKLFMQCYVGENSRNLLILGALILTLPAILVCACTWIGQDAYNVSEQYLSYCVEYNKDPQHWMVMFINVSLSFLFAMVAGSRVFSALTTKHSRENFFVIPASTLEKFVALIIIYIVGYSVLMFVSVNVSNLIRPAIFGHVSDLLKPLSFKDVICATSEIMPYRTMIFVWMFIGVSISTFTVGSVLWPSNSFIKTTVALIAIGIVTSTLTSISFIGQGLFSGDLNIRYEWMANERTIVGIAIVVEIIYSIACIVYSYYRLKQWEVISRW